MSSNSVVDTVDRLSNGPTGKEAWLRYMDVQSGLFYWHNAQTNESRWETSGAEETIPASNVLKKKRSTKVIAPNIASFSDFRNAFKRNPDYFLNPDDSEADKMLIPKTKDVLKKQKTFEIRANILRYRRFIYLHACVFETPCAIIESSLRAGIFLLASFITAIVGLYSLLSLNGSLFYQSVSMLRSILREVFICVALVFSLIIFPFGGCFVYWLYKPEGAWEVSTIPTMLGWVDPRRLAAYSLGMGSTASNIDSMSQSSMDSLSGGGSILCAPREVLLKIVRSGTAEEATVSSELIANVNGQRIRGVVTEMHGISSHSSQSEDDADVTTSRHDYDDIEK